MKKYIILLLLLMALLFYGSCGPIIGGLAGAAFGGHPGTAQEGFESGLERDFGITPSWKKESSPNEVMVSCGDYHYQCTTNYYHQKKCGYVWISKPCHHQ